MIAYFIARTVHVESVPWYEIRTKSQWSTILNEEDLPIEWALLMTCLWSATQQGSEEGPVWPIALMFTDRLLALQWLKRERKMEPNHVYEIVAVEAIVEKEIR